MSAENFCTEQEKFWAGNFGEEYISRNKSHELLASNLNFFSRALRYASDLSSCIEFGANIGMNIRAIQLLYPNMGFHAVEINSEASRHLSKIIPPEHIDNLSILDFNPKKQFDLAVIKGVLIHLNPEYLNMVYEKIINSSNKYILIAEYYNPTPVALPYRGYADKLFKRDFVGEILDTYANIRLIDYGFSYRRDPSFPQDDITWFLLEKIRG